MNSINHFLEFIAKEVKQLLGALCEERTSLDEQVMTGDCLFLLPPPPPPSHSAFFLFEGREKFLGTYKLNFI